jgi:choline dehydrogenase-like flavoprotein
MHWTGYCRPLTATDFAKKEGFEEAYWPIEKADLDPFLSRASSILEIPAVPKDIVIDEKFGIKQIEFVFSPPVRFGYKYKAELDASRNIKYFTNTNLTLLENDGSRIVAAKVENFQGEKAEVRAEYFVLALGGLENSRLLLWSNEKANGSLLDPRAPLGRFWMEHPHYTLGKALVDVTHRSYYSMRNFVHRSFFTLTDDMRIKLGILKCGLRVEFLPHSGTLGLAKDLLCVAPTIGEWALSLAGDGLLCGTILRAASEEEPIYQNRIQLSKTESDRFGLPRIELYWKKTKKDLETIQKTALQFNEHLIAGNYGRIWLADWVLGIGDYPTNDEIGGPHHMGGTRMAESPKKGVVDRNCLVFGQQNLFVAGSSVFPSGGHANPTLTIVQLSLRLADHLKTLLAQPEAGY